MDETRLDRAFELLDYEATYDVGLPCALKAHTEVTVGKTIVTLIVFDTVAEPPVRRWAVRATATASGFSRTRSGMVGLVDTSQQQAAPPRGGTEGAA